ncbi:tetratricopeptide repeat protein [Pseudomonas sp. MM211]|uniref:SirB1 family protein n=1 Tax=Pseudomonas sp. MM211 TaxID=2866808 RepID=UPI001CED0284|nr:transglutaminase family protein [Pseudomonas sp. MM211]UCJ18708.1 tetratricopeptide repeat protein [Pseudomonas sp. MM211]
MRARDHCLACLNTEQPALFEAALWVAAEHDIAVQPKLIVSELDGLKHQVDAGLPNLPAQELAQPLLRRLNDLNFHEDDDNPVRPQAALLHKVLLRRRGQPLSIALIALELARRLNIPLQGVNFPGYFLLRVPGADHLLDPCGGRRLYTRDCRELLLRYMGPQAQLSAEHMLGCDARSMIVRLSRNLRYLHGQDDDYLSALKDAERVLQFAPPNVSDHLARADLYQRLDCPQAERFDVQRALLLCDDPALHVRLGDRLRQLSAATALH